MRVTMLAMINNTQKKKVVASNVKIMKYVKLFYLNGGLNVKIIICALIVT